VRREYVGLDLHRRRSVIYRMGAAGRKLDCVRIDNDPLRLAEEVSKNGPRRPGRHRSDLRVVLGGRSVGSWG
jgi:hypothetical protein